MRERPKTLNEALQLAGQYQGVEESQKRLHGASAKNVSEKSFENHNVIRRVFSLWVGKEDDSESESEAVAVITNATRPSRLATQVEQLGKQIETLKLQLAATNNGRTYPRSRPNDAVSRKRSDGVVCWYCGKRGHIKRNCAKLKTSIETAAVGSCLSVDGRLGKLVVKILIDTGSAVTLVRDDVWKKVQQSPKTIKAPVHSVVAANGEKLELVGQACCQMYISASALDKKEAGAVLLEPLDTFMEDHGLLVARSLSQVSCNHLVVQVLNPGPAPVVVNKDVRVGVIKPVTDSDIVCSIESTKSNRHVGHSECAHLIELMLQNTEHLSSYHKSQGVALLQEFEDVIAKSDDDLGQTSLSFHTIDTGDNQPIRQHARRLPFHQHKELSDLVDSMLSRGIIESSDSPWASPVVLVRKKDGKTRPYLYGRKFLLRTDHNSLRWLHNFKEPEGQVARWLETMAEFQYEVIHRPGKQHCNADSLSCGQCRQCGLEVELETDEMFPVCEISLLPAWKNQEVADFQRADTDLEQVITWLQSGSVPQQCPKDSTWQLQSLWTQCKNLLLKDGILYRQWEDIPGGGQDRYLHLVIPPTHIPRIMVGLHDSKIGGHMGVRKTLEKIRRRFYWPGQKSDVVKWCSNCIACNSRKSPPRNKAPLEVSHASRPLERITMDIMGPLPETPRVTQYTKVLKGHLERSYQAVIKHVQQKQIIKKTLPRGKSRKLNKPWQGPYRVVKAISPSVYRIVDCARPRCKRVVHFNRLKPAPLGNVPPAERVVNEEEHMEHSGDTAEEKEEEELEFTEMDQPVITPQDAVEINQPPIAVLPTPPVIDAPHQHAVPPKCSPSDTT
eukprot:Em0017g623a